MSMIHQMYVDKVVIHMGVGEAGEKLVKAEKIMGDISGQKSIRTIAKRTQPAFNIKKGQPIGCKVSLRGETATAFLKDALNILENRLFKSQFDKSGNVAFGVEEHTDFPGQSYDPTIGIYGMDINVVIEKKGVRIARRSIQTKKLSHKQRVTREEAVKFMQDEFGVEVQ